MSVVGSVRSNRGAGGKSNTRMHFSWPKKTFSSKLGVFPCGAHVDPHIECTGELRNGICRKKTRLNSNKRCIPAILTHFNKMMTSHKIASLKTTNFAILSDFLIEFDNCSNDILGDIESCH